MGMKGIYRKLTKGICDGCDHPAYAPSKNVNPKNACKKCIKEMTKSKSKQYPDEDERELL